MNPAVIGAFFGAFFVSLAFAAIWLVIAKIIPSLRNRPTGTYLTAIVLCVLPQLVTYGGPGPINFSAALACILLLAWQMNRAQKKLRKEMATEEETYAIPGTHQMEDKYLEC